MGGTLILTVGLATALILLLREGPQPALSNTPAAGTLKPPQRALRWMRQMAVLACAGTLAFQIVGFLLAGWIVVASGLGRPVGLGPGQTTLAVLGLAGVLTALAAVWRTGSVSPKTDPAADTVPRILGGPSEGVIGGLIVMLCAGLVYGAAALNGSAFATAIGWGMTLLGGAKPAAVAEASTPTATATANSNTPPPADTAGAAAQPGPVTPRVLPEVDAQLASLVASIHDARQAKVRIANEVDTPSARDRVRRYPSMRPSFEALLREQEQFVEQARGYAQVALGQVADARAADPASVKLTVELVRGRTRDPLAAAVLGALADNLGQTDPNIMVAATMAMWDRSVGVGEPSVADEGDADAAAAAAAAGAGRAAPDDQGERQRSASSRDRHG